tara:strand:- start:1761 stop:2228 length:468 start_codon:yes stop_codon:yes gene_type:complete
MEICITRFDNKTYNENKLWRIKYNINGCIYGTPIKILESIYPEKDIIVIEMNNTTNTIEGFGLIKNKLNNKKCKIYSDNNYNRYIYSSNFRIDKSEILDNYIKNKIIEIEKILFTSAYHCKRGHGIQRIPKFIKNIEEYDYIRFIKNVIKSKFVL